MKLSREQKQRMEIVLKVRGVTNAEASRMLDHRANYMGELLRKTESAYKGISSRALIAFCDAFGVNMDWVLTGNGEMNAPVLPEPENAVALSPEYKQLSISTPQNELTHQAILDEIHDTYVRKNHDYGDSFAESCREFGITAAVVRIKDKYNRLATLSRKNDSMVAESLRDTLLDMANYAIMTAMFLDQNGGVDAK